MESVAPAASGSLLGALALPGNPENPEIRDLGRRRLT